MDEELYLEHDEEEKIAYKKIGGRRFHQSFNFIKVVSEIHNHEISVKY